MEKGYESGRQLPITGDNQVLTPYQCQPMNPQQPIMYNMPPCQYQFVSDPLAELMYAQKASVKKRLNYLRLSQDVKQKINIIYPQSTIKGIEISLQS